MKLSRSVEYALNVLIQLAQSDSGKPLPCSAMARSGIMPERFLLQILHNLVTHGILKSTRGVWGGYELNRPFEAISLLDVIEAVEGPVLREVAPCSFLPRLRQEGLCNALLKAKADYCGSLHSIKIQTLVEPIL